MFLRIIVRNANDLLYFFGILSLIGTLLLLIVLMLREKLTPEDKRLLKIYRESFNKMPPAQTEGDKISHS